MLLKSGLVGEGLVIGVTQPRRLAAVSVAHRIAAERGGEVGGEVGYAIRFDDQTGPTTRIKVMTDGILLQEARTDPNLSAYGVIMVDEAHERSLNIDFTLGLLKRLMQQRPELKLVVSSATINAEVFTRFFDDAPRVYVDAKVWDIDIEYRPLEADTPDERVYAVASTVAHIHTRREPGDILVFLNGEGLIKKTLAALEDRNLSGLELLPLYGRLTREEQERVFDTFPGRRKVVLATNIAETSITIDGVRYVVDLGLAKVPSYDTRTGIPSLNEVGISQASARQRAGRAGRTAPGVCVRLYDEREFKRRDAFPTEEVLRMDLTEVVLRLVDLGIRDVEAFPFVTRPPRRLLKNGVAQLFHMGAIDKDRALTDVGKRMVPFPLSPRLSRMLVAAADHCPDVLHEVVTVGALLSVRWPQVMPTGEEDQARAAHRRFAHPLGDLAAGLGMVRGFERAKDKEAFSRDAYLDEQLMEELLKVRSQLQDIARVAGLKGGRGGPFEDVIRCVVAAFPRSLCQKLRGGNSYETATGVRVSIHPASCLWHAPRKPRFCVAADIVVTRRAWARAVSWVEPEWILDAAPDVAREWGIKARKRDKREQASAFPGVINVLGGSFPVRIKKRRPQIEIPWSLLREAASDPPELDELQQQLTVVVLHDQDRLLAGLPLAAALRVAPLLRIDEDALTGWPEGELLDGEREMWRILRGLGDLLRLVRSRRRGKAAFLTLIPNGAGAYWFDAAKSLPLAVEQCRLALGGLLRESVADQGDKAALEAAQEHLDAVAEALSI